MLDPPAADAPAGDGAPVTPAKPGAALRPPGSSDAPPPEVPSGTPLTSRASRGPAAPLVGSARDQALAALAAARPLALCLDIDGTLAPIAPRPEDARTPEPTLRTLQRLAAHPGVYVALVTGRAPADARALVPVEGLWVVGNHGAEVLAPGTTVPEVDPAVATHGPALDRVAAALAPLAHAPGVLVENKRWTLSLHTRLAPPEVQSTLAERARALGEAEGLRVDAGKSVLEFKAPVAVDKGTATLALLRRWHATDGASAVTGAGVLAAGDDTTDEHLFHCLHDAAPAALTVRVGADVPTWAEYRVDDPAALAAFLGDLADALTA